MGARAVEAVDACSAAGENRIGAADKKTAFDDPDDVPDALLQPRRIGDRTEAAVKNAVAAISDERFARRREAQPGTGAEHFECLTGRFHPEGDNLHWNRCAGPQPVYQLGLVDDDCEPPAGGGYDLLVQQCSAQSLDQIERAAFNLVSTVDF